MKESINWKAANQVMHSHHQILLRALIILSSPACLTLHKMVYNRQNNNPQGQLPPTWLVRVRLQNVRLPAPPSPSLPGARQTDQQGIQQPSNHLPEINNKVARTRTETEGGNRERENKDRGSRMQHPGVSSKTAFLKGGRSHAYTRTHMQEHTKAQYK